MLRVISLLGLLGAVSGQDRPLAPAQPQQISCSGGASAGSLQVACKADFATTDEVDFGVSRADDPQNWASVHFTVDVGDDGFVRATIPGLLAGVTYKVAARAHHRGASEGWNEKWSAVTSESALCQASLSSSYSANSNSITEHASPADDALHAQDTTWIEVFRYRGPGYHGQPAITDYNLPDFLDNHNTGDANKQLSRWDFPGSSKGANYSIVSYTRYCVEVLNVQLTTSVHAVGIGGPTKASEFSTFLPCDAGKCHCANKFDAFELEAEINSPKSWVDSNCPSVGNCRCEDAQLAISANYTGRWTFSPPFTDDAWMDGSGQPRCGWSEHQYPCHGDASPKGYFYHHPESARCKFGAQIGDNGCTWRRSPLMHTLSVQQLLDAGSIGGGSPTYHKMSIEEELHSVELGKRAFAQVGAQPCGPQPTPAPTPGPTPTPAPTPPSPSDCPGGSLAQCIHLCPSDPSAYQSCMKLCIDRCSSLGHQTLDGILI